MKRTAGALVLLAAVGGCVTTEQGMSPGGCGSCGAWTSGPPRVPGVQGPWGEPVTMVAPYSASPPGGDAARAMMAQSVPMDLIRPGASGAAGSSSQVMPAGGMPVASPSSAMSPSGRPFQPIMPCGYPPGAVGAAGALTGPSARACPSQRTEVRFLGPPKMQVSWYGATPDGRPSLGHIDVPGRYNFVQGAAYRLKLSNIQGLPGVELYPTLEVVPANARTEAFLAHSAVPVSFTNEDLEQIQAGNYLVKVVYLPNPQFQDLAAAGPDEIVSSRLEPGADPIAEAHRRGNILLVIRLGNIDLGLANSPPLDAPSPFAAKHAAMPGMQLPGMPAGGPAPAPVPSQQMMMMWPNAQLLNVPTGPMQSAPIGPTPTMGVLTLPGAGHASVGHASAGVAVDSTTPNTPANTVMESTEIQTAPKRHWWSWWRSGEADN